MATRRDSKRKATTVPSSSSECDVEGRSAAYDTQSTKKPSKRGRTQESKAKSKVTTSSIGASDALPTSSKGDATSGAAARDEDHRDGARSLADPSPSAAATARGRKRKVNESTVGSGSGGKGVKEEDECGADPSTASTTARGGEESCAHNHGDGGATVKRTRRALVNHRINKALLERARLVESDVLPGVALHYVIDRRLNQTDIEWKLRSTAIGLVLQCPFGLGEVQRRKLIEDVRSRILGQSKDKKQRTTLSVLKKANMIEMRAKYGGMRYTAIQTQDGNSYAVLGNLPGHREVAEKLAELKARIVPLLVHFNVELKELKEIVSQSLRGRIFTNKDAIQQDGRITARIDLRVRQFTNLEKLRSDRGLMITLIHELAHAITPTDVKQLKGRGKVKVSHGPLFWENVMKIAKVASEIEDPSHGFDHGGDESEGEGKREDDKNNIKQREDEVEARRKKHVKIFELKDELEFRHKIEKEDSLSDELDDDDEDEPPPAAGTSTAHSSFARESDATRNTVGVDLHHN